MQLYGALVLLVTLSATCGLKCYTCEGPKTESCTNVVTCTAPFNRCISLKVDDKVYKSCGFSCEGPDCCKGDLCNSAIPTGSSVLLLLVSSAIMTVFL